MAVDNRREVELRAGAINEEGDRKMADENEEKTTESTNKRAGCTCTPEGAKCSMCIEAMRGAGVPDRTLKWMEMSKIDRIMSVMF